VQEIAQVVAGRKTREVAAERADFGNHETYRQAAKVVANGTPQLIQAMDGGRVSISAASILADAEHGEQQAILQLDEKAILQTGREIGVRRAERRVDHQATMTPKRRVRPRRRAAKSDEADPPRLFLCAAVVLATLIASEHGKAISSSANPCLTNVAGEHGTGPTFRLRFVYTRRRFWFGVEAQRLRAAFVRVG
jgi:hypothetical protein